jgi:hypothetical protein
LSASAGCAQGQKDGTDAQWRIRRRRANVQSIADLELAQEIQPASGQGLRHRCFSEELGPGRVAIDRPRVYRDARATGGTIVSPRTTTHRSLLSSARARISIAAIVAAHRMSRITPCCSSSRRDIARAIAHDAIERRMT